MQVQHLASLRCAFTCSGSRERAARQSRSAAYRSPSHLREGEQGKEEKEDERGRGGEGEEKKNEEEEKKEGPSLHERGGPVGEEDGMGRAVPSQAGVIQLHRPGGGGAQSYKLNLCLGS